MNRSRASSLIGAGSSRRPVGEVLEQPPRRSRWRPSCWCRSRRSGPRLAQPTTYSPPGAADGGPASRWRSARARCQRGRRPAACRDSRSRGTRACAGSSRRWSVARARSAPSGADGELVRASVQVTPHRPVPGEEPAARAGSAARRGGSDRRAARVDVARAGSRRCGAPWGPRRGRRSPAERELLGDRRSRRRRSSSPSSRSSGFVNAAWAGPRRASTTTSRTPLEASTSSAWSAMSVTASSARVEHQHPRDVQRDVAGADHHHALPAQVELVSREVGMAVVPADEVGRRVAARQSSPGIPSRGRRGADRVDDRVVVLAQVGERECRPNSTLAKRRSRGCSAVRS